MLSARCRALRILSRKVLRTHVWNRRIHRTARGERRARSADSHVWSTEDTTRQVWPSSATGELRVVRRLGKLVNLEDADRGVTRSRDRRHRSHAVGDARQAERGERAPSHRLHRQDRGGPQRHHRELHRVARGAGSRPGTSCARETDTETVAHLVEATTTATWPKPSARRSSGSTAAYALGVVHLDDPDTIVAARKDSPLIIGIGEGENIVASDIPAVLEYTREVLVLHDGQVATVTARRRRRRRRRMARPVPSRR